MVGAVIHMIRTEDVGYSYFSARLSNMVYTGLQRSRLLQLRGLARDGGYSNSYVALISGCRAHPEISRLGSK